MLVPMLRLPLGQLRLGCRGILIVTKQVAELPQFAVQGRSHRKNSAVRVNRTSKRLRGGTSGSGFN